MPLGVGAQLVGHHDHAGHARRRRRRARAPRRSRGRSRAPRRRPRRRRSPRLRRNARLPTATRCPSTDAGDPLAGLLAHVRAACRARARRRRAARTSASPSTCAESRSTDAASRSTSAGVCAPSAITSRTSGVPTVSVPVLSNSTVRASPSVSIAPAPLTITPARAARESPETSAIGAARISGHGVATTTTASARTGSPLSAQARPGDDQRDRQEEAGVAVGHAHERRALALRLLDEPHERGVRALGGGAIGAHVERRAGVGGAAQHRHAAAQRDRQRLAAERARVDDRLGADDRAVDRDHLAGAHEHDVARHDRVDRHLRERVVDAQLRDPRRTLDQPRQLAPGAAGRRRLERRAAGEHQPDHRSGELLAERQRADHRHERDRVDAEVAVDDHRVPDLERQLRGQQRHGRPPHLMRRPRQRPRDGAARRPRSRRRRAPPAAAPGSPPATEQPRDPRTAARAPSGRP